MDRDTFEILAEDRIIGYSKLEHQDPSMGAAFGCFAPAATFEEFARKVEPSIEEKNFAMWRNLSVKVPDGLFIECLAVAISFNRSDDDPIFEAEVLGISFDHYKKFFE